MEKLNKSYLLSMNIDVDGLKKDSVKDALGLDSEDVNKKFMKIVENAAINNNLMEGLLRCMDGGFLEGKDVMFFMRVGVMTIVNDFMSKTNPVEILEAIVKALREKEK